MEKRFCRFFVYPFFLFIFFMLFVGASRLVDVQVDDNLIIHLYQCSFQNEAAFTVRFFYNNFHFTKTLPWTIRKEITLPRVFTIRTHTDSNGNIVYEDNVFLFQGHQAFSPQNGFI